jgi:hypothetical protein
MDAPPCACVCGCENFRRVTVPRSSGKPYTTDFVACAECRAMFHCPAERETVLSRPDGYGAGIGGPR